MVKVCETAELLVVELKDDLIKNHDIVKRNINANSKYKLHMYMHLHVEYKHTHVHTHTPNQASTHSTDLVTHHIWIIFKGLVSIFIF